MRRLFCTTLGIVGVVWLTGGTVFAGMVVGKAKSSWGTVTLKRGGSTLPFSKDMPLEDGDEIETDRQSGAKYELYDRDGDPCLEEEVFGLPGPKGCADAPGDEGRARVKVKAKDTETKRITISVLEKGTAKSKTLPGKDCKEHEVKAPGSIAKKKGTDYAVSYELGADQTSLSTLEGTVEFDNIVYATLPNSYFTDPGNKCDETLDMAVVLGLTSDAISVSDLLGAGNTVDVGAGYYSIVASPPIAPLPGLAPIHKLPGGLSPEPTTVALLALGALALLRRRK